MARHIIAGQPDKADRRIGPRYTEQQRENLAYYRWQIRLCNREIAAQRGDTAKVIGWRTIMQQCIRDIQRAARQTTAQSKVEA